MNIMQFLMKHWNIASRQGLNAEAQQAQEDVCKLESRWDMSLLHLGPSRCSSNTCIRAAVQHPAWGHACFVLQKSHAAPCGGSRLCGVMVLWQQHCSSAVPPLQTLHGDSSCLLAGSRS